MFENSLSQRIPDSSELRYPTWMFRNYMGDFCDFRIGVLGAHLGESSPALFRPDSEELRSKLPVIK